MSKHARHVNLGEGGGGGGGEEGKFIQNTFTDELKFQRKITETYCFIPVRLLNIVLSQIQKNLSVPHIDIVSNPSPLSNL